MRIRERAVAIRNVVDSDSTTASNAGGGGGIHEERCHVDPWDEVENYSPVSSPPLPMDPRGTVLDVSGG